MTAQLHTLFPFFQTKRLDQSSQKTSKMNAFWISQYKTIRKMLIKAQQSKKNAFWIGQLQNNMQNVNRCLQLVKGQWIQYKEKET